MQNDAVRRLSDAVFSAMALLTRLPVPGHRPMGAESAWAWPLVGALLGGLAAFLASALRWMDVPAGPTAAVVLAFLALLTGALHEDGLSDAADGLLGGRDRARRLEIMKDSRIGSYGALALVLVMLCSWAALAALIGTGAHWPALIAAAALSRAGMVVVMHLLPNARPSGYSAATGRPSAQGAALAVGLAALLALILLGSAALAAILAASLTSALLAMAAQRMIGGQTGDILGASQQLAFAACLTLLA
ncbi:adenosylcobinamide-GDP ribazoletransferase [Xinfangfangia sp. CPCC 101601]|uniref:Adenosylcobinamide-GDP ribazoletransferase n=1 Tax=Pseudogemmobacter lacusdianii TaxID=3069608 RepID=A0ABU0VTJ7_9RHOB|nr:adenosylcobinamide-GDP ribazoletransferase [Xinfangfangia sp. CPCC 101601]MDQ2064988.1 adenosylcobinamide-GDP ribazoletransferase [Xinfangfangia sp. CPCC 101601]